MKISRVHSHLNGYEFIQVHSPDLWNEIHAIVAGMDCISKKPPGRHYSVSQLKKRIQRSLTRYGWEQHRTPSFPATKFVKNRVALDVKFGEELSGPYGLLANHIAQYANDAIDVGIEVLPMKGLSEKLSPESASYEDELSSLIREGRGVPGVPLVLVGVAP